MSLCSMFNSNLRDSRYSLIRKCIVSQLGIHSIRPELGASGIVEYLPG